MIKGQARGARYRKDTMYRNNTMVKHKKAILFSIITIMLTTMIIIFSVAYSERSSERLYDTKSYFLKGALIAVHDAVAGDILSLHDVESLDINSTTTRVTFLLVGELEDAQSSFSGYKIFLQERYSSVSNMDISLLGESGMIIEPLGIIIKKENEKVSLSNCSELERLKVSITLNESQVYLRSSHIVTEPGTLPFELIVIDNQSSSIYEDTLYIDLDESSSIGFEFNRSGTIQSIGLSLEMSNITVEAELLDAEISLELSYPQKNKIYLKSLAHTYIKSGAGELTKNSTILLGFG